MNQSIWKFPTPIVDEFSLDMPEGAEILDVERQDVDPCIWALVNTDAPLKPRRFAWYGTGHRASGIAKADHIGTVLLHGGRLVFHLFERRP